jgi:NAD(P)-dependent dehydrogenase (short-subunit alcohol dehydrogenase family)
MIVKADMTVTADARRAVRETVAGLGGLDIIISNAVSFFHCVIWWKVEGGWFIERGG